MGCGTSQIREDLIFVNSRPLPKGFASQIKSKVEKIEQQKLAPSEDVKHFISYLLNNEIYFSVISQNEQLCFRYHSLIDDGTKKFLDCIVDYIKSNFIYAVSITKILSFFSLILFRYYLGFNSPQDPSKKQQQSIREKRFQDVEKFKELKEKIEKVEKFIEVEKEEDPLRNTIQFYLFFIKSAIEVTPTNSKEGQEILQEFGSALLDSASNLTIKKELLISLAKGIGYLYNKYDISQLRNKYMIMFNIQQVKLQMINMIEKSNDSTKFSIIMEPLDQLYTNVIKQSNEWEIWCCWIQTLSDLFQYKQVQKISNINTEEMQQIENSIIHEINEEEYVYEINCENIQKNTFLKKILENTSWYHVTCALQKSLINGSQQLDGFEQIYALKMKQEENTKGNHFSTSLIIKLTNFVTHLKEVQQEYLKKQDSSEIQEQKRQQEHQQTKELIKKIIQLELQLQQLKIWNKIIPNDQPISIELKVSKLIKQLISKVSEYRLILKQKYEHIFGQTLENLEKLLLQPEKNRKRFSESHFRRQK